MRLPIPTPKQLDKAEILLLTGILQQLFGFFFEGLDSRSGRFPCSKRLRIEARRTGNMFEKQRVTDIFRVPFVVPAPKAGPNFRCRFGAVEETPLEDQADPVRRPKSFKGRCRGQESTRRQHPQDAQVVPGRAEGAARGQGHTPKWGEPSAKRVLD